MKQTFKCNDCKQTNPVLHNGGVGYARMANRKICYACCAIRDQRYMEKHGKITLYFDESAKTVTNWPGTLSFIVRSTAKGRHNIAGTRIDVWFVLGRQYWHGVQYGNNTQIVHCKRTKQTF